jgi:hypothetical protein
VLHVLQSGTDLQHAMQAFEERTRANVPKPIERKKVEPKIKDFVRDSIRRLMDKRPA